ncbi:MAG: hypothetical protein ACHQIM_15425, partial [Sphingobacteriales bacterium]
VYLFMQHCYYNIVFYLIYLTKVKLNTIDLLLDLLRSMKIIGYSINYSLFLCMQTLEIKVPDNKTQQVKEFLKELGVTVKEKNIPNAGTIAAMDELKAGRGKKFKNVEELFSSI